MELELAALNLRLEKNTEILSDHANDLVDVKRNTYHMSEKLGNIDVNTAELVKIFNGSKNIATTVKYGGLMAATVLAIYHFGSELVNHAITYFRGWR